MFGDWSFDSKWIAYTVVTGTQFKEFISIRLSNKNLIRLPMDLAMQ
jgi:hypothetical protein